MKAQIALRQIVEMLAPDSMGASMPPPASEDEIRSTEEHVGHMLPESMLDAYRIHNGGPVIGPTGEVLATMFLYDYEFLTLEDMRYHVDSLRSRLHFFSSLDSRLPSYPRDVVRRDHYRTEWVPFAKDGAGNFLAIDFAPGPRGLIGQIINFGRDDEVHFQLAPDFERFLETVVADYQEGRGATVLGDSLGLVDRLRAELLGEGPYSLDGGGPYVPRCSRS